MNSYEGAKKISKTNFNILDNRQGRPLLQGKFSRTQKGFQSLQNILLFTQSVNFDSNNESNELSDDRLRVKLKKGFFPYIALAETTDKIDQ